MTTTDRHPEASEYAPFYASYVAGVPEGDILDLMREHGVSLSEALAGVDESHASHRYADGKWSIREVVGHLIDAERIFTYRALRIARGDTTPLPGFDENQYVPTSGAESRRMADLLAELSAVRASSVALFASLPEEAWTRIGVASGKEVSVRAIASITLGHAIHHLRILRERYGIEG